MQTERRVMHFDIPFEEVINLLLPGDEVTRCLDTNLPSDVRIICVETDHSRRAFRFYISSESFEEVVPGCCSKAFLLIFTRMMREQPQENKGCHNCGQTSPDPCIDCCQEGTLTHWKPMTEESPNG